MDRLIVVIHSVKMPVGFGKDVKSKGRPLSVMAHVKHIIIEVKTETNCLAQALIIAIARLTKDPNYKSYNNRCKIRPEVQLESIYKMVEFLRNTAIQRLLFRVQNFRLWSFGL